MRSFNFFLGLLNAKVEDSCELMPTLIHLEICWQLVLEICWQLVSEICWQHLLASAWQVLTQLRFVSKCHKLEEFDAHGEVKSGRFERKQRSAQQYKASVLVK